MYLHLGSDYMVATAEVVAIINVETLPAPVLRESLRVAKRQGPVVHIGEDNKGKSLVLTDRCAYLSPISSVTLLKRSRGSIEEGNQ